MSKCYGSCEMPPHDVTVRLPEGVSPKVVKEGGHAYVQVRIFNRDVENAQHKLNEFFKKNDRYIKMDPKVVKVNGKEYLRIELKATADLLSSIIKRADPLKLKMLEIPRGIRELVLNPPQPATVENIEKAIKAVVQKLLAKDPSLANKPVILALTYSVGKDGEFTVRPASANLQHPHAKPNLFSRRVAEEIKKSHPAIRFLSPEKEMDGKLRILIYNKRVNIYAS